MSRQLRLILLGTPEFFIDDQSLTNFNSNKTRALLIYLALTRRTAMRTSLAGLFWGGMSEEKAHTNLRKSIANLKKLVGDWLIITRQTIAFAEESDYWIDVQAFEAAGQEETAVSLYNGDFLDGFYVDDAPEFEQWLLGQRARLREQMLAALYHSIISQTKQRHEAQAIAYCQRLLSMEAWREETHQQLMRLYARSGQRTAALAQYKQCQQILWDELGILPASETEALYERIKQRPSPHHNLTRAATPFIGRADEITALQNELLNPDGRLLTILGTGGIGKTRLAQATAQTLIGRFLEGVWFVELADVDRPQLVPHAIGTALGLHFAATAPADVQLIEHLRSREMLLILDNMEHLVETVDFLAQLLQAAPELTLLLTSRREIQLQEEQIWTVEGLPYPPTDAPDNPQDYAALTLFEATVRRRNRRFTLNGDVSAVSQICRLVVGSPLAIELAAAATRQATPTAIAAQLQANLGSLQSQWRNAPQRHRSLRAVFDHSWALLTVAEREAFRQLAIFHGTFSAEAAAQIAQVDSTQLANLASHSLLRAVDSSHFALHELLRQFALEQLQAAGDTATLNGRHSDYYLNLIAQQGTRIATDDSLTAQQQIVGNFANIVAAWRWHTSHRADHVPLPALRGWLDYFLLAGNAHHGHTLLTQLCADVAGQRPFAPHLHAALADLEVVVGRIDDAQARLRQIRQTDEWDNSPALRLHSLTIEISILIKRGQNQLIAKLADEARTLLPRLPGTRLELVLLNQLGTAHRRRADYDAALTELNHLQRRAQTLNNRYHEALALLQTAVLHHHYLDNYQAALPLYEQALAIAEPLGFKTITADCRAYLGVIYSLQGDYQRSLDFLQHALHLYRDLGEPITEGLTLINLCHTYDAMDEYEQIGRRCRQGVELLAQAGAAYYEADGCAVCSSHAIIAGDYMTARDYLQTAVQTARDGQDHMLLARALWRQIWLFTSVGDLTAAEATLHEAQSLPSDALSAERQCGIALAASLLYQYQGKLSAALQMAQQAAAFAQETAPYWQADCAAQSGYILLAQQNWPAAAEQFGIIHRFRGGMRQLEAQAGLAIAAHHLGNQMQAQEQIAPVIAHLQKPRQTMTGAWQATAVYLHCYELLGADETADQLLSAGYNFLQQRWQRLDAAWQATFWQNVPSHKRLKQLAERL